MADEKDSDGIVDKFILGALIGGAIGSVLGVALAPKSGKENRKTIFKKYKEVKNKLLGDREHQGVKEESPLEIKRDEKINTGSL
jgi:gas vesicle protein